MKTFLLLLASVILSSSASFAQPLFPDDFSTQFQAMKYTDVSKMSGTPLKGYSNIEGNYLWNKDWYRGAILMKPGNILKLKQMNLNLYTQEIQFPVGDNSMTAGIDRVKAIVLFQNAPGDTTAIAATFEVIHSAFYEVLNKGNIQLLKRSRITTKKVASDGLTSTGDKTYFSSASEYLIRTGTELKTPKNLSKSSILEALPNAEKESGWLTDNKNKLKKEEDVIAFFDHLNSLNN